MNNNSTSTPQPPGGGGEKDPPHHNKNSPNHLPPPPPNQLTRAVSLARVEVLVTVVLLVSVAMLVLVLVLVVLVVLLKMLVSVTAVFVMATKHVLVLERIVFEKVPKIKVHTSSLDSGVGVSGSPGPVTVKMKATEHVVVNIVKQVIEIEGTSVVAKVEVVVVVLVLLLVLTVVLLMLMVVVLVVIFEVLVESFEKFVEIEVGFEAGALVLAALRAKLVVVFPLLRIRQHSVGCEKEKDIPVLQSLLQYKYARNIFLIINSYHSINSMKIILTVTSYKKLHYKESDCLLKKVLLNRKRTTMITLIQDLFDIICFN